jgi:hypothetical protein
MDAGGEPANPHGETGCSVTNALTFGAVDVSWTPPLRNVFLGDNESRC